MAEASRASDVPTQAPRCLRADGQLALEGVGGRAVSLTPGRPLHPSITDDETEVRKVALICPGSPTASQVWTAQSQSLRSQAKGHREGLGAQEGAS